jgi:hypothetical protein
MDSSTPSGFRRAAVAAAIVVAASGGLVWFYTYHKPIDSAQLLALGRAAGALAVAASIVVAAAGPGRAFRTRWIDLGDGSSALGVATDVALGMGGLSVLWVALSLLGLLQTWLATVVLVVLIVAFLRQVRGWAAEAAGVWATARPRQGVEMTLAVFVALILGVELLEALAPPTAWDSILYHLTLPRDAIAVGHAAVTRALPEGGYPQAMESLYAWALLLGTDRAPAALHWFFGFMAVTMAWSWGSQEGQNRTGWLAAALLLGVESFSRQMGRAYVDLAFALFGALALAWAIRCRADSETRSAVLAGLLAGMAFGVKYFGVWIVVGTFLVVLTARRRGPALGLAVLMSASLLGLPWLVRNAILTGNPVYPFLFGGDAWDSARALWFSQWGSGWLPRDPVAMVLAPFSLVLTGTEGRAPWDFTVGPLLLLLSLPIILRRKHPEAGRWIRPALLFGGVLLAAWMAGGAASRLLAIPRLLMPWFVPWSVIAAVGWEAAADLNLPRFRLQKFLSGLTAIMLALGAASLGTDSLRFGTAAVVLGVKSEQAYLYERLGWHYAAMEAIGRLPPNASVQFLFEPRSYYAPPHRARPDGILDEWFHARRLFGDPAAIVDAWRTQGVTHVLVHHAGADFLRSEGKDPLTESDWSGLDELVNENLDQVEDFGGAYSLYKLPATRSQE